MENDMGRKFVGDVSALISLVTDRSKDGPIEPLHYALSLSVCLTDQMLEMIILSFGMTPALMQMRTELILLVEKIDALEVSHDLAEQIKNYDAETKKFIDQHFST